MGEAAYNVYCAQILYPPPFVRFGHANGREAPRLQQTTMASPVVVADSLDSPYEANG